jgi:hypothetical protein
MSALEKLLAGWTFRTRTPSFEPGAEVPAVVTGFRDGSAVVRVGDSELRLPDAGPELVDTRVRLRVLDFDDATHTGTAEVVDVVGEAEAL